MIEEWKPIFGYEDYYEISNLSRIRSLDRVIEGVSRKGRTYSRKIKSRILKQYSDNKKNPYKTVDLAKKGKIVRFAVHVLMGLTYIPNPRGYPIINHKDGIKTNNKKDNLEWCTYSMNTLHAIKLKKRAA